MQARGASTQHSATQQEGNIMKLTPKVASVAVAVMALGGAGIGTAVASGTSTAAPAAARTAQPEPASPDHDAIQQGDQTSPDAKTAAARTAQAGPAKADNPGEAPESASESENSVSDGPGGHADPAGDVQNEFNGVQ
jgi:hypothetical protein